MSRDADELPKTGLVQWSLKRADVPATLEEYALRHGYEFASGLFATEGGRLDYCYLRWTRATAARQGLTAEEEVALKEQTTLPSPFAFDLPPSQASTPDPRFLAFRPWDVEEPDLDAYRADYRRVAAGMTGDDRLIGGARIPELKARVDTLRQRLEWDAARFSGCNPDLGGWARVVHQAAQQVIAGTSRPDPDRARHIESQWKRLWDSGVGGGADIGVTLGWAEHLLEEMGAPPPFTQAQLSGLALFLVRREPAVRSAVEHQRALDLYEPLLRHAVLGTPPLSEEALAQIDVGAGTDMVALLDMLQSQLQIPKRLAGGKYGHRTINGAVIDQMWKAAQRLHSESREDAIGEVELRYEETTGASISRSTIYAAADTKAQIRPIRPNASEPGPT